MAMTKLELKGKALKKYQELKAQAELFDMDVDWLALELIPKRVDTTPQWLKNWRERLSNDDRHFDNIIQGMEDKEYVRANNL